MSLDYASGQLGAAVRSLATSESALADRLQVAWDEHVQMIWMKPCLTSDLLRRFKGIWERYTAPSEDSRSTALRALSPDELVQAIDELIRLWLDVANEERASVDPKLATLADLP